MTLVRNLRCFRDYESPNIDWAPFAAQFTHSEGTLRTLLSAYLELTQQSMRKVAIGTPDSRGIATEFVGALYSDLFADISPATRYRLAQTFVRAYSKLDPRSSLESITLASTSTLNPDVTELARAFSTAKLDPIRVKFWKGWATHDSRGKACFPRLHPIFNRFGPDFTDAFFLACKRAHRLQAADALPGVNDLASFLGALPPPVTSTDFNRPDWVESLINAFFVEYFQSRHADGLKVTVIKRNWAALIRLLDRHILGKDWARPAAQLPVPPAPKLSGHLLKVRSDDKGRAYKEALLTSVPLYATDDEALEILFKRIEDDLRTIEKWAWTRINTLRANRRNFDRLTETTRVARSGEHVGIVTGDATDQDLTAACAQCLFARGYRQDLRYPKSRRFNRVDTSRRLGIPNRLDLLAYAAILVIEHPAITPAFVHNLQVKRVGGAWTATVVTDSGHYLIGYKNRKGPNRSEQRIKLNDASRALIEELLVSTDPIRNILANEQPSAGPRLFVGALSYGHLFDALHPVGSAHSLRGVIADELSASCGLPSHEAYRLAQRFTLSRLRASAGVMVYLRTGSAQAMSEALGHTNFSSQLLEHYLPQPIQDVFYDRWIRIFQSALICEAMKGSPHLLPASGFSNMDELNKFLQRHALRLPSANPGPAAGAVAPSGAAIFNIRVDVLTILFSIEQAVEISIGKACGSARMWARISQLLKPHLSSRPDLSHIVRDAELAADPALVADVVYA